jgi:hypothetical protein
MDLEFPWSLTTSSRGRSIAFGRSNFVVEPFRIGKYGAGLRIHTVRAETAAR